MIRLTLLGIMAWLFIPKKLSISFGDVVHYGSLGIIDGDPEQPAAPDYTGAAEATAAGDLANARYATESNRPDMYNPFGSSVWTQDPENPDSWSNTVSLSPDQQKLFDTNNQVSQGMSETALTGLNAAKGMFGSPLELQKFQGAREEVKNAMLSRVTKDIGQDRDSLNSSLIAKGIPENSEAYKRAMEQIDRKETDARAQVNIQATDQALKEHQQTVSDAMIQRNSPLNELNALRTGTQVSNPTFNPFANQQTTAGPDYMGATMAQGNYDMAGYNAEVAQQNAIYGGLFGIGAAAAGRK